MDKQTIKDLIYGAIVELQQNDTYYYRSKVGVEYSHWRDRGEQQLVDIIKLVSARVDQYERDQLKLASQQLMLDELKKDHK